MARQDGNSSKPPLSSEIIFLTPNLLQLTSLGIPRAQKVRSRKEIAENLREAQDTPATGTIIPPFPGFLLGLSKNEVK